MLLPLEERSFISIRILKGKAGFKSREPQMALFKPQKLSSQPEPHWDFYKRQQGGV